MPPRAKNPNDPAKDDQGWLHYVEPFAGGLAVLLANDPTGISEVINDKNYQLTNFWTVLRDDEMFEEFQRIVQNIPFSEVEWVEADPDDQNPKPIAHWARVESAVAFFVRCRQSMSGRMDCFSPLTRNRTRRGMNEQASAWLNAIDGLPLVHDRMKRVVIIDRTDALGTIKQQDGPRTLFYLDPPYVPSTRTAEDVYEFEMTEDDHFDLLARLCGIEGRFLLSGYRCDMYDGVAADHGWKRHDLEIDNKSGKGETKERRIESVWTNY